MSNGESIHAKFESFKLIVYFFQEGWSGIKRPINSYVIGSTNITEYMHYNYYIDILIHLRTWDTII